MSGKELDLDSEEVWEQRCNNCIRCFETNNCRQCGPCRSGKTCDKRRCFAAKKMYSELVRKQADENLRAIMAKTAALEAQNASTSTANEPEPVEKKRRGRKKKEVVEKEKALQKRITESDYVPNRPTRQQSADLRRKSARRNEDNYNDPVQCLNPDCIYEAEFPSKYCSKECGMMLARLRINEILPKRAKQYFADGPCGPRTQEAELTEKLNSVRAELGKSMAREEKLVEFLEKLHLFIEKQLDLKPLGTDEKFDDNLFQFCIICGSTDITVRKYVKHLELCWARSEKSMSFGAPEKNNEAIYCEFQDPRTLSFCKRLKSLCPEHRKPGVEKALEVCGYPKRWKDLFAGPGFTGSFSELIEMEDPFGDEGCRTKKDACHLHSKWVPSIRGCIELERAGQFQKCADLCAEANRIQERFDWHTNALSIMLHEDKSKVVDAAAYKKFVARITSQDEDMEDIGEFLASLAVKKDRDAALERYDEEDEEEEEEGPASPDPSDDDEPGPSSRFEEPEGSGSDEEEERV